MRPLLLLPLVVACSEPPCEHRPADQQDLCRFDEAVEHAEAGRGAEAIEQVRAIGSPLMKGAALRKVIALDPAGLDGGTVEALCEELPGRERNECLRTWRRPHLWEKGTR